MKENLETSGEMISLTPEMKVFGILKRLLVKGRGTETQWMKEESFKEYTKYIENEVNRFVFNIKNKNNKEAKFQEAQIESYEIPPIIFQQIIRAQIGFAYFEYEVSQAKIDENTKLY